MYNCGNGFGGPRLSDPLELGLQAVASPLTQGLGTKPAFLEQTTILLATEPPSHPQPPPCHGSYLTGHSPACISGWINDKQMLPLFDILFNILNQFYQKMLVYNKMRSFQRVRVMGFNKYTWRSESLDIP